jgi:vancomycin resistance protein YoaR
VNARRKSCDCVRFSACIEAAEWQRTCILGQWQEQSVGSSPSIRASQAVAPQAAPARLSAALFRIRVVWHQLRRAVRDSADGGVRFDRVEGREYLFVAGESRTALWSDLRAVEAPFQGGKVHNLRIAAESLNGTLLLPGRVFSFWMQIGRASKRRGYLRGRMLQQGCMIPAVGGGLCQLSNALYDVALQTGCEIVERHAHSRVVPGSVAAQGRDATVAWNYVDLRFRAPQRLVIRAQVTGENLVVSFCAAAGTPLAARPRNSSEARVLEPPVSVSSREAADTCGTCARTGCFRKEN